MFCFFSWSGDHRDLHVLTHSFPTRRSSDLLFEPQVRARDAAVARRVHRARSIQRNRTAEAEGAAPGRARRRAPRMPAAYRRPCRLCRIDQRHIAVRSEEHTSELQSLMRISYAVFCWKKKKT